MLYGTAGNKKEYSQLFHVCGRPNYWLDEVLIIPVFFLLQTASQLQALQSLHDRVLESFQADRPPHVLQNGQSWVSISPESTWSKMCTAKVQEKLRTGVIVIEPCADEDIAFDRELFVDMLGHGNMKYAVPMEGESLYRTKPHISENFHIKTSLVRGD